MSKCYKSLKSITIKKISLDSEETWNYYNRLIN